jgi:ribonuclease BN (tRNA processing enzyme)
MKIRVLGCSGAIANGCKTTSFLIDNDLLVDAGTGVGDLYLWDMAQIDHVLLTHAHLDHVAALPLLIDAVASRRTQPLHVHALPETITALKQHIFNNVIWPDFSVLPTPEQPFLVFHSLALGDVFELAGKRIEVLPAIHTVPAVGYAIAENGPESSHWVFSGDTGHNPDFWTRINQLPVGMLIIETAFSEREAALAERSLHLCPHLLAQQLEMMQPQADYPVLITHTKPAETKLIMAEIARINQERQTKGHREVSIGWLTTGQELHL